MKKQPQSNTKKVVLGTAIGTALWSTSSQPSIAQTSTESKLANTINPTSTAVATNTKPELVIQKGTGGFVQAVALSPDGKTVATGDFSGAIRLWDSSSSELIRVLENHQNNLRHLNFSSDGKTLLSSDIWGQIRLWNLETGTGRTLIKADAIRTPVFSQDNKTIVINGQNKLQFFDDTGKTLRSLPPLNSNSLTSLSPDGNHLITGGWQKLQLINAQSGVTESTLIDKDAHIYSVQYAPDGNTFLVTRSSESANNTLELRNATGSLLTTTKVEHLSSAIAFAPDGQSVAVGADLYSLPNLKMLRSMRLYPSEQINDNAFARNGKTPVIAGFSSTRLVQISDGKILQQWDALVSRLLSAAFSRDGKRFAVGTNVGTSYVWNVKPFKLQHPLAVMGGMIGAVTFDADGTRLFTGSRVDINGSGDIEFWRLDDPKIWYEKKASSSGAIGALILSPDGKNLAATGSASGSFAIFSDFPFRTTILSTTDGKIQARLGEEWDSISALRWSHNSKTVTTAQSQKAQIKCWTADGALLSTINVEREARPIEEEEAKGATRPEGVQLLALSPNAKQVAGIRYSAKQQRQLRLWDTTTGKAVQTFDIAPTETHATSFSPNSQLLAMGDDQGNVSLFDLKTGQRRVIQAHPERVTALAWSPRGTRLVSTSMDGTTKFWDTSSTRLLATLWVLKGSQDDGYVGLYDIRQTKLPQWIAYTPEGFYVASPGADAFIRWRVGNQLFPASQYAASYLSTLVVEKAIAEPSS